MLINVQITMLKTDEGGRRSSVSSGYRPMFSMGNTTSHCSLELSREGDCIKPGEDKKAKLFILRPELFSNLNPSAEFKLKEGERVVGFGIILNEE